ncbi:hypothetical protein [Massilia sp. TSP1-1-2]|uniref:hypothetical protein n=1 Tax=unclassified Massilia TaxID=2609279 RepID=UPI003CEA3001
MLQELPFPFPVRIECPPGLCVCEREQLLADPAADKRILMLTREQEKKMLERIERIDSYAQLQHVSKLMLDQLGIVLTIAPAAREVKTVRGLAIGVREFPGLCRKTRQAIPAAIRRCLEQHPEIVYAILDEHDLFGQG